MIFNYFETKSIIYFYLDKISNPTEEEDYFFENNDNLLLSEPPLKAKNLEVEYTTENNRGMNPKDFANLIRLSNNLDDQDQVDEFIKSKEVKRALESGQLNKTLATILDHKEHFQPDEDLKEATNFHNLMSKDLHTPDDGPEHDHEAHEKREQQKLVADIMAQYLNFVAPSDGEDSDITVQDFYQRVEALVTALNNLTDEEGQQDSIDQFLDFLKDLENSIKDLDRSKDINDVLNTTDIDKVNRLFADYVSSSNSKLVYAKIQEALKEVGEENVHNPLSKIEINGYRRKKMNEMLNSNETIEGRSINGSMNCDPLNELTCDDGKQLF